MVVTLHSVALVTLAQLMWRSLSGMAGTRNRRGRGDKRLLLG